MTTYVPFLFIFFAIALALGPVMMLRPTKKEKRLANIRTVAISKGFAVQKEGLGDCMSYTLPWGDLFVGKNRPDEWRIKKLGFEHGAHFSGRWDWEKSEASDVSHRELKEILKKCEHLDALGVSRVGAYICWNEKLMGENVETKLDSLVSLVSEIKQLYSA